MNGFFSHTLSPRYSALARPLLAALPQTLDETFFGQLLEQAWIEKLRRPRFERPRVGFADFIQDHLNPLLVQRSLLFNRLVALIVTGGQNLRIADARILAETLHCRFLAAVNLSDPREISHEKGLRRRARLPQGFVRRSYRLVLDRYPHSFHLVDRNEHFHAGVFRHDAFRRGERGPLNQALRQGHQTVLRAAQLQDGVVFALFQAELSQQNHRRGV